MYIETMTIVIMRNMPNGTGILVEWNREYEREQNHRVGGPWNYTKVYH